MTPPADDQPLWVVTSYFNPAGYRRRLRNFRQFRQHLRAPLLAVELSFPGSPPALQANDADRLLHIDDGDILWQKERLLNLAMRHLPSACRAVAWVDCDLVFGDPDWARQAQRALEERPVLQLAGEVRHPGPDAPLESGWPQPGLAQVIEAGLAPEAALRPTLRREPGTPFVGMAWAARRPLLERHGLYDLCVVGGGDTAFAAAAWGCPEIAVRLHGMNAAQRAAYLRWAHALHADVRGDVGHLPQVAYHLWHGELADRRAAERHALLTTHDFDPATDLLASAQGAWRWAPGKPALAAAVRAYFEARQEDGRPGAPS